MLTFVETGQRVNGYSIYSVETIKALKYSHMTGYLDFIILKKALW